MVIGKVARPALPPMEGGTYTGICVGAYYIGEQETNYKGKTGYDRQVLLTFEFPDESIEIDGKQKPRQMSKTVTATTSKRGNLRGIASSLMKKDYTDEEFRLFDTDDLLGRSALLKVEVNDSKERSKIVGWMPLPKGMPQPTTESELLAFSVTEWDDDKFAKLPEWVQERIKKSTEYQSAHAPDAEVDFPEQKAPAAPAVTSTASATFDEEACPF